MSKNYTLAAGVLRKLLKGHGGIKSLAFAGRSGPLGKVAYALVCETIRYKAVLDELLKEHSPNLFKVGAGKESGVSRLNAV